MNQKHLKPTVIHLTVDDESWLQERRREQEGNKPHRSPAPPEDERLKEERGKHEKKAATALLSSSPGSSGPPAPSGLACPGSRLPGRPLLTAVDPELQPSISGRSGLAPGGGFRDGARVAATVDFGTFNAMAMSLKLRPSALMA